MPPPTDDQAAAAHMGPTQELQLLQMLRELLSNALRHSNARQIRVSLRGRPEDGIELTVTDDGIGFDPADPELRSRHLGLTSMEERARELGGRLELRSAPGSGTTAT